MFDVLDQLIGPLSAHITALLSQPISGTDDQRAHVDTKKAYLALLNNIMAAKLHGIFTSESRSPSPCCSFYIYSCRWRWQETLEVLKPSLRACNGWRRMSLIPQAKKLPSYFSTDASAPGASLPIMDKRLKKVCLDLNVLSMNGLFPPLFECPRCPNST